MTDRYKRMSPEARPFLGDHSFVDFWFGWASSLNTEFRQPCNWCGWTPQVLACDGTQLGIPENKLNISSLTTPADQSTMHSVFDSRLSRCFLRTELFSSAHAAREAREGLRSWTQAWLGRRPDEHVAAELVQASLPPDTRDLFEDIREDRMGPAAQKAAVEVFSLLSYEACVTAFMPTELASMLTGKHELSEISAHDVCRFNVALGTLVAEMQRERVACQQHVFHLIKHLVCFVKQLQSWSVPPQQPSPVKGSYNPARKGHFYYFSPTGEQLRQTRGFPKDATKASAMYDETPSGNFCHKNYGKLKGCSPAYIFFFFCPAHGHCYGGHIIDGREGRKDPSCALYTHMETAPSILFYDFACSLEEYNLNRESGFWINTRLYHDIFHGYSHVCSPQFKMNKAASQLTALNTSICEQFNAYIKRIKLSAEHMTQQKFIFFVQFFLHRWNMCKAESCQVLLDKVSSAAVSTA